MKNNTEINSEILSNQTQVNYPPPAHAEVGASQLAGGQPVYFTLSYRIIPASVIDNYQTYPDISNNWGLSPVSRPVVIVVDQPLFLCRYSDLCIAFISAGSSFFRTALQ